MFSSIDVLLTALSPKKVLALTGNDHYRGDEHPPLYHSLEARNYMKERKKKIKKDRKKERKKERKKKRKKDKE